MNKWCLLIIGTLLSISMAAQAQSVENIQEFDFKLLEDSIENLKGEWKSAIPGLQWKALLAQLKAGQGFDWREAGNGLVRYFFSEIMVGSQLLAQLLVLVVLTALLTTLENSLHNQGAARIAQSLMFIAIMGVAIQSLQIALRTGKTAISNMVSFMQALLPILLSMLVASGAVASTALMHPFLLATITMLGTVAQDVVFPLLYLGAVLSLVTYVVPEINVGRLATFIHGLCATLLGLTLCVFVGVSTIQGAAGKVVDGVSMRSAKFLAGSFVPVIGKLFADAVEAVVGYSAAIQTAVSSAGMVMVLLLCAFPLIKILALIFIYKLAAALAEPIANVRVARCLGGLGNSLGLIFVTVGVVALLFFLTLTALMGLAGISLGWG
ncbi:MAG TPA: stage III sporulation protein AE [bacterium]|nr:stage III sporulation protein AE [bacterium]